MCELEQISIGRVIAGDEYWRGKGEENVVSEGGGR